MDLYALCPAVFYRMGTGSSATGLLGFLRKCALGVLLASLSSACKRGAPAPTTPGRAAHSGVGASTSTDELRAAGQASELALARGDATAGAQHAKRGLSRAGGHRASPSWEIAQLYGLLGRAEQRRGRKRDAHHAYEQQLHVLGLLGLGHLPQAAWAHERLAEVRIALGAKSEAEQSLRTALAIRQEANPPYPLATASTLHQLAFLLGTMARYAEAEPLLQSAKGILAPGTPAANTRLAKVQLGLGVILQRRRPQQAKAALQRAVSLALPHESLLAATLVSAYLELARIKSSQGSQGLALADSEKALAITKRNPATAQQRFEVVYAMVRVYRKLPQQDERAEMLFTRYGGLRRAFDARTGQITDTNAPRASAPSTSSTPRAETRARVHHAARVIASLRPGFQACYNDHLKQAPRAQGALTLSLRVATTGEVDYAVVEALGLPRTVADCVLMHAQTSRFDAHSGGLSVMIVPLLFVRHSPWAP